MSGVYTPKPAQQQTYTQAQDGDNKPVASINVKTDALADGLSRLNLEAYWWGNKGTTTNSLQRAAYSPKEQTWFAVGNGANDFCERSQDHGRTWINLSGTIGLTGALSTHDIAINNAGQIVIINVGSQNVYSSPYTTYGGASFTNTAAALSHAMNGGQITYDETNVDWITCYRTAGGGMKVNTSTNMTAWTNRTAGLPAAWTGYANSLNPVVHTNPNGKTVMAFYDDTGAGLLLRVVTSTDGGVTLVDRGSFATAVTATTIGKPVWDSVLDEWYIVIAETTGTPSAQVFRSSDSGATWTSVYSDVNTNGTGFQDLATFNGILIALQNDGRMFVSVDRGVTWKLTHRNIMASAGFMRSGNGQILVICPGDKTTFNTLRLGAVGV